MKIDVHTHILPENWPDLAAKYGYGGFMHLERVDACSARMVFDDGKGFRTIRSNCWDPAARLEECDRDGVDMQVLSTVPVLFNYWTKPAHGLDWSRFVNDHLAGVVAAHPTRFTALGTVPLQDPDLAVEELTRCVGELGFPGVEIGTHVEGRNLSDPALFPFFEAAAELGAAIFVHPWDMMGKADMEAYWLPWLVGMPAESSRAICSVIFGGVLERLPSLRLMFAHGGGSFPFTLGRIEHGFLVRPDLVAVDNPKNPREYINRLYLDSLVHDPRALEYLKELFGVERLALGSDYPFPLGESHPGSLVEGMDWSPEEKARVLRGTALEFLGLKEGTRS